MMRIVREGKAARPDHCDGCSIRRRRRWERNSAVRSSLRCARARRRLITSMNVRFAVAAGGRETRRYEAARAAHERGTARSPRRTFESPSPNGRMLPAPVRDARCVPQGGPPRSEHGQADRSASLACRRAPKPITRRTRVTETPMPDASAWRARHRSHDALSRRQPPARRARPNGVSSAHRQPNVRAAIRAADASTSSRACAFLSRIVV